MYKKTLQEKIALGEITLGDKLNQFSFHLKQILLTKTFVYRASM